MYNRRLSPCDGQAGLDRVSGAFEEHDIDQVALFSSTDERGELVRQDLIGGVDHEVIAFELIGMQLGTGVLHEVDHHALVSAGQDQTLEARRVLSNVQHPGATWCSISTAVANGDASSPACARADATYDRKLRFTSSDLLVLDDLGLRAMSHDEPLDLYEIIRQRYQHGATIITSNLDVEEWHPLFGDALLGSPAMDRLLHNAHVVVMDGDTYRNPPLAKKARRGNSGNGRSAAG